MFLVHEPGDVDFVSIGTSNGNGVSGTACADDYDPKWTIYVDAYIGGMYTCFQVALDVYGSGANPSFVILYNGGTCTNPARWQLSFGGVQRACILQAWDKGERIDVGIEVTGSTVDRNIDAIYTNLKKNYSTGSTWFDFGACDLFGPPDPNYEVDTVSNTQCNTYLPPLD